MASEGYVIFFDGEYASRSGVKPRARNHYAARRQSRSAECLRNRQGTTITFWKPGKGNNLSALRWRRSKRG